MITNNKLPHLINHRTESTERMIYTRTLHVEADFFYTPNHESLQCHHHQYHGDGCRYYNSITNRICVVISPSLSLPSLNEL